MNRYFVWYRKNFRKCSVPCAIFLNRKRSSGCTDNRLQRKRLVQRRHLRESSVRHSGNARQISGLFKEMKYYPLLPVFTFSLTMIPWRYWKSRNQFVVHWKFSTLNIPVLLFWSCIFGSFGVSLRSMNLLYTCVHPTKSLIGG